MPRTTTGDKKMPHEPMPLGTFGPKEPQPKEKGKDFLHCHVGTERLQQMDAITQGTNRTRTELVKLAWDYFVSREDVFPYIRKLL